MSLSPGIRWLSFVFVFVCGTFIIFYALHHNQKSDFTGRGKSIAVITFTNADTSHGNDYLSEGMMSEIVDRLSGISGLRVVSTSQVKAISYTHLNPQQIGAKLQVTSLLEGQIKKTGDAIHIHVDLIDVASGKKFWSRDFESGIQDLFSFQNELAQVITEKFHTKLTVEESRQLNFRPTRNLEAYDQYLKGIYFWNKRDRGSLNQGIEFFKRAIALDSGYARAWSGLADCFSALGYGSHDAPSFDFLQAETAALRALELDSSLAEPHTSLGYIYFYYYWDWGKAEKEFLKAIRLNPNYPLAHDAYVYLLTARERYAEASVELEKAITLDPASPFIQTDKGFSLYYAGHYDRAISALKDVHIQYPSFPLSWIWLGRAFQEKKNYPECLNAYRMSLIKDPEWPVALAASGFVYGISGQQAEAEKRLLQMTDLMKRRYVTPYAIALVYAGLGNKQKTFEFLNQAYSQRTHWLVWLKQDPRWAFIKNDPRYLLLLQKIGLNIKTPPVKRD